jgi:DNA-binding MarR family transcriptional regulator
LYGHQTKIVTLSGPTPRLLNRLLLRPALAMRLHIQRAIEEAGFDDFRISHMNVFAWLPDSGARVGELARQSQLSKQTMTELVSYLEKHGYVYRTRDPSDGRAWIIRFTERGALLDQVARRALRDTEAKWAQALGQRAYAQLRNHLESLLEVAEATSQVQGATFADLSDHRPLLPAPTRARRRTRARGARPRSKAVRKQLR